MATYQTTSHKWVTIHQWNGVLRDFRIMGMGGKFRIVNTSSPFTVDSGDLDAAGFVIKGWLEGIFEVQVRAHDLDMSGPGSAGEYAEVEFLSVNDEVIFGPVVDAIEPPQPLTSKSVNGESLVQTIRVSAKYLCPSGSAAIASPQESAVWQKGKNVGFVESVNFTETVNEVFIMEVNLLIHGKVTISDHASFLKSLDIPCIPSDALPQSCDITVQNDMPEVSMVGTPSDITSQMSANAIAHMQIDEDIHVMQAMSEDLKAVHNIDMPNSHGLTYKGTICQNSDFPPAPKVGDWYVVAGTSVTDLCRQQSFSKDTDIVFMDNAKWAIIDHTHQGMLQNQPAGPSGWAGPVGVVGNGGGMVQTGTKSGQYLTPGIYPIEVDVSSALSIIDSKVSTFKQNKKPKSKPKPVPQINTRLLDI